MPDSPIAYKTLNTAQLLVLHNELATKRGKALLTSWRDSRYKLVERIALLRTVKELPPPETKMSADDLLREAKKPKRKQPVRDAILRALAIISYYENAETGALLTKRAARRLRHYKPNIKLLSVGLSYPEVADRVRARRPDAKISGVFLRFCAAMARKQEPGFEHCTLPHKRPQGKQRKITS